jgi:hypothetical protein
MITNKTIGLASEVLIPSQSQSSNKNAYEIRTDILAMALDWVKWQTEKSIEILNLREDNQSRTLTPDQLPNSDAVLEISKKFYTFVENKK